jgi:hypothetical protein
MRYFFRRVMPGVFVLGSTLGCRLGTDPGDLWHFRGTVVKRSNAAPVAGVPVRALYRASCGFFACVPEKILKTTKTDSQGKYSLDVDEGEGVCLGVTLEADAPGGSSILFGTVNDCEGKGDLLNVTLYVN